MKKLFVMFLATVMCLCLVSCGSQEVNDDESSSPSVNSSSESDIKKPSDSFILSSAASVAPDITASENYQPETWQVFWDDSVTAVVLGSCGTANMLSQFELKYVFNENYTEYNITEVLMRYSDGSSRLYIKGADGEYYAE